MITPLNEMGVVVLFSQTAHMAGFEIVEIQSAFPDAILVRDGIRFRTEFEFVSANFRMHGHDARECDLIVCWKHDYEGCTLPVVELSLDNWWTANIEIPTETERELMYWRDRASRAESLLRKLELSQRREDRLPRRETKKGRSPEEDETVLGLAMSGDYLRKVSPKNDELDEEEAEAVRSLYADGWSIRQLVDAFYTSYNAESRAKIIGVLPEQDYSDE